MIARNDLKTLTERVAKPDSPVLSVYLDTDQSEAINVQRGFVVMLKDMLREIWQPLDKDHKAELEADAEPIMQFLKDYRAPARGLVIFSDASEDFFWLRELRIRGRNGAWWNDVPHVRPLF